MTLTKFAPRLRRSWPVFALFLATLLLAMIFASSHLQMGLLNVHNMDEHAYHGALLNMLDGLRAHDLKKFFAFGFYNYGVGFFVANLLLALPFLLTGSNAAAIFVPRLFSTLCALLGLAFIYRFARAWLSRGTALLLLVLVLSMPGFWTNATVFHPDWLMTACLLGACYHLHRQDEQGGRHFWYAVLWFAAAVALAKFQALTFLPALLIYLFQREGTRLDFTHFVRNLRDTAIAGAVVLVSFVVTNPYVLNASGRAAFLRMLSINMEANETNLGATATLGILDKISGTICDYYVSPLAFILVVALALYWVVDMFRLGRARAEHAVAGYVLAMLGYLLVLVNKGGPFWQHYYLPVLMPAVLLVPPFLARLTVPRQHLVLGLAIASQILFFNLNYAGLARLEYTPRHLDQTARPDVGVRYAELHSPAYLARQQAISDFAVQALRGHVRPDSTVAVTSFTGFDFPALGLDFRNVTLMSAFSREVIDPTALAEQSQGVDATTLAFRLQRFRPKDFLIFRKNDANFRPELRGGAQNGAVYAAGGALIARLPQFGYRKLAENGDVVIYQHVAPAGGR